MQTLRLGYWMNLMLVRSTLGSSLAYRPLRWTPTPETWSLPLTSSHELSESLSNSHLLPLLTKAKVKVVLTKGASSSHMNRRLNISSVLEPSITRICRSPSQTDEAYSNFVFPATIPEWRKLIARKTGYSSIRRTEESNQIGMNRHVGTGLLALIQFGYTYRHRFH